MFLCSGTDYVMGVKACIREKDHVVIVMPYFPHDKFQVRYHYRNIVYLFTDIPYSMDFLLALQPLGKTK